MDVNNLKPSQLGISSVSYDQILNGKINTDVRMALHQQGMLKAFQEICVEEGKDHFIPVEPTKLMKRLKNTSIAPFIPKGDMNHDIQIMIHRGWLKEKDDNQVAFTDYAKEILLRIKVN